MSDWKYDVDDVGGDAPDRTLRPGSPSLENALFVVLGALATVLVVARLALLVS